MTTTRRVFPQDRWFPALVAGITLAAGAQALEPAQRQAGAVSVQSVVKDWESAEERLTSLLDQVPEQARKGIERAIEANRQGRERAQEALDRAGADSEAGQARAQRALEDAAARAEAGLNEARKHVSDEILSRLDDASASMRAGLATGSAGVARQPESGARPTAMPSATFPESRQPTDIGRPDSAGRPAGAGTPTRRPGG